MNCMELSTQLRLRDFLTILSLDPKWVEAIYFNVLAASRMIALRAALLYPTIKLKKAHPYGHCVKPYVFRFINTPKGMYLVVLWFFSLCPEGVFKKRTGGPGAVSPEKSQRHCKGTP